MYYLFMLPISYPAISRVTYLNPISFSFLLVLFNKSSLKNLCISSLPTSILAISLCALTLNCLNPTLINYSSLFSIFLSNSLVIFVPYGILVARHAKAGLL